MLFLVYLPFKNSGQDFGKNLWQESWQEFSPKFLTRIPAKILAKNLGINYCQDLITDSCQDSWFCSIFSVRVALNSGMQTALLLVESSLAFDCVDHSQGRHLRGAVGTSSPSSKEKEKKKKRKKKEKREKNEKKMKERKKGTMNNVKLLHIVKCCFLQFFDSPVALKNKQNLWPPRKS